MNKIIKVNIVPEYYINKADNDYIFLFDKLTSKDLIENCIKTGYYFEGDCLYLYLETEVSIELLAFHEIETRSSFKLKRLKKITFMENTETPFCYDILKIKKPTLN